MSRYAIQFNSPFIHILSVVMAYDEHSGIPSLATRIDTDKDHGLLRPTIVIDNWHRFCTDVVVNELFHSDLKHILGMDTSKLDALATMHPSLFTDAFMALSMEARCSRDSKIDYLPSSQSSRFFPLKSRLLRHPNASILCGLVD